MANEELKVGDVVQLKSGSFDMVIGVIEDNKALCYWSGKEFDLQVKEIFLQAIEKVK